MPECVADQISNFKFQSNHNCTCYVIWWKRSIVYAAKEFQAWIKWIENISIAVDKSGTVEKCQLIGTKLEDTLLILWVHGQTHNGLCDCNHLKHLIQKPFCYERFFYTQINFTLLKKFFSQTQPHIHIYEYEHEHRVEENIRSS